jgi:hypothetical protein
MSETRSDPKLKPSTKTGESPTRFTGPPSASQLEKISAESNARILKENDQLPPERQKFYREMTVSALRRYQELQAKRTNPG